mmetsp:Transcript_18700/g.40262  ORF Transcript_18700/g.40262 Transcript_18700/m.40262 type:complete len:228 (+) Transcript_18700:474-1157(+)
MARFTGRVERCPSTIVTNMNDIIRGGGTLHHKESNQVDMIVPTGTVQWCVPSPGLLRHVGTVRQDQTARNIQTTPAYCKEQRCSPALVLPIDGVGTAMARQKMNHFQISPCAGPMEGCPSILVFNLHVGTAVFDQVLAHRPIPLASGNVQWRISQKIPHIDICLAAIGQVSHHVQMACIAGSVDGCFAPIVLNILPVGIPLEDLLHSIQTSIPSSHKEILTSCHHDW